MIPEMIGVSTRVIKKGETIRHNEGMMTHYGVRTPHDEELEAMLATLDDELCWIAGEDIPSAGMFLMSADGETAMGYRLPSAP